MKVAITGGTGLVGKKLTNILQENGYEVTILTRSETDLSSSPAKIQWLKEGSNPEQYLEGFDAFINLAGASLNEGRWTEEQKEAIYNSRKDATTELLRIIHALDKKPATLVNASAVGIYPTSESATYTENSTAKAQDFLGNTVAMWEQLADKAKEDSLRVVKTRFGVIFDKESGAFPLLAKPYKLHVGGNLGSGMQWVSWVHVEDVARALAYCLEDTSIEGVVNVTAPFPIRMKQVGETIAAALQTHHLLKVPSPILKVALGEKSKLILEGQKVIPTVLNESHFTFNYPTIAKALQKLL